MIMLIRDIFNGESKSISIILFSCSHLFAIIWFVIGGGLTFIVLWHFMENKWHNCYKYMFLSILLLFNPRSQVRATINMRCHPSLVWALLLQLSIPIFAKPSHRNHRQIELAMHIPAEYYYLGHATRNIKSN